MAKSNPIRVDTVKDGILPQRLSVSDVLQNAEKEFALFTPALLFTHGGFDRDPIVEFASYYSESFTVRPAYIDLYNDTEFFFRGLGVSAAPKTNVPVNWDKRLYAIPVSAADDCFAFLGGICWANPQTGFFARTFSYMLDIPDPIATRPELLSVRVFGVTTRTRIVFINGETVPPSVNVIHTTSPENMLRQLGASNTDKQLINPFEP